MTPERRALSLLDALYESGVDITAWSRFIEGLSDELGGAAITVASEFDEWQNPPESYWVRLDASYAASHQRHLDAGLPWGNLSDPRLAGRFVRSSTLFPDAQLAKTVFYREWMKPQGLACEGPLSHAAPISERRQGWLLCIYRLEGARAFESDDIALCDLLSPHLVTSSVVFDCFSRLRRKRVALSEVVDRFSLGILLLDAKGRLLIANLAARRIVEANDGLSLRDGVLRLDGAEADSELRQILQDAIAWRGKDSLGAGGELWVERPSGRRPYLANIVPMNPAEPNSALGDDVAVVLLTVPDADQSVAADRIRRLYKLTGAEAELIRLMAEGFTLEEISRERGVTISTTRTHLKHVFSKTGTARQSELVAKVLSSGMSLGE